jgi:RHS repeat-associated protein
VTEETLTYREVLPGVDVELTPLAQGVKEELVLTSAKAPREFLFDLSLEGLTARVDKSTGNVEFVDPDGGVALVMTKGWMRDSSTVHDGREPAESDGVRYELTGSADAPQLRVGLDDAWLSSPERVFPVRVDPTTSSFSAVEDTYVNSCYTNNYSSVSPLKVGGSDCQRASYMRWNVGSLAGKTVLSGRVVVANGYSYSCSARAVNLYRVTSAWSGVSVSNWPGPSFATPAVTSSSFAHGYSGACPGWFGVFDATSLVAGWVSGSVANHGVTLRASDTTTSDAFTYKEFASAETALPPTLDVTWSDPNAPFGNFEAAHAGPGFVRASGWAIDPNTTSPIDVHLYVDSAGLGVTANQNRPDVGAGYPAFGPNHGFLADLGAAPGSRNVCAYAINVGAGTNQLLACKTVVIPTGNPFGNTELIKGLPDQKVRLSGWGIDPDTGSAIDVHAYVGAGGVSTVANVYRPDVGSAYPAFGPNHGFNVLVPAAIGTHTACAYGINTGPGSANPVLGACQSVTVPTGQVTGTWETAAAGPGELIVAGWAYDPDVTAPVNVSITIDGGTPITQTADLARADAAIPDDYGDNHGFALRTNATLGDHTICVTATDISGGQTNTGLIAPGGTTNCTTVTVVDNGVGTQPWYTNEDFTISDRESVGVNLASGNATVNASDLQLAGRGGLGVGLGRSYSSRTTDAGMFGPGWFSSTGTDVRIDSLGTSRKIVTTGGGTKIVFSFDAVSGKWTPPPGINAVLEADGTGWKLSWYQNGSTQWFDANGRLTTLTDREATSKGDIPNRIAYSYTSGRLTTITDTYGRTTTFAYTGTLVDTITDPIGRVWNYDYTGGKLTSVTNPAGDVTTYTYNSGHGDLETMTVNGDTTTITYTNDRATKIARPNSPATDDTEFTYYRPTEECRTAEPWLQAAGHGCTKVVDPRDKATFHRWDASGRLERTIDPTNQVTSTGWSSTNNIESYTDVFGATNNARFDSTNRFEESKNPNGTVTGTATYNTGYGDDDVRRFWLPDQTTDRQGNATTFDYDGVGNVISSTTNSQVTKTWYNADGSIDYVNDARTTVDTDTTYRTAYHYTNGDLTGITHPAPRGGETRTPDGVSRTASHTDGNGVTATYTYDGVDRVTRVDYSTGEQIQLTYDDAGNVTQRIDASGAWTFTHDAQNRVLTKAKAGTPTQTSTYDAAGNLATYNDGGGIVSYTYDDRNQVDRITIPGLPSPGYIDVDHDEAQRRTDTKYPNGITETMEYRQHTGQLERIYATTPTATLTDFTYTYTGPSADQALRATVKDLAQNTTTYTYDGVNRLDTAITRNSSNAVTASWDYGYDPIGNITQITTGPTTTNTYRTYNAAAQLCYSGSSPSATCPGTPAFTYDANGNQLTNGPQAFTYNNLNQTTGITNPAGASNQVMSHAGSTQDERLTRGNTTYANGAFGVQTEVTSGQATRYRYDDTGAVLVRQGPGGASDAQYYLRDGHGSIVAMVSTTGTIVANYTYDPYGKTLSATGTHAASNPWRYASGYTDTTTGLTKFGTRYYSPEHGRWTQPDHWGSDYGYNYAGSNPVNAADPTGRYQEHCGPGPFDIKCTIQLNGEENDAAADASILAGMGAGGASMVCARAQVPIIREICLAGVAVAESYFLLAAWARQNGECLHIETFNGYVARGMAPGWGSCAPAD